jgi:hypothetical protein
VDESGAWWRIAGLVEIRAAARKFVGKSVTGWKLLNSFPPEDV